MAGRERKLTPEQSLERAENGIEEALERVKNPATSDKEFWNDSLRYWIKSYAFWKAVVNRKQTLFDNLKKRGY